ncbi:hypothetical protein T492DRAFT_843677 [Pavlovales sp. CCMP2436]|nr:hypothetical protein T492DRAFT_843677 [Pavlovales sp. CCMP2436]
MLRMDLPESSLLNELPTELLLRIFEHLSSVELCRCACVSSSWTSLVLEPKFWTAINFDNLLVDGATVLRVCQCYPELERLSLRNLSLDARHLCAVFRACPRITSLTLAGTRAASGMEQVLHDLAQALTSLTELDLSTLAITNSMLRRLQERCASLQKLTLSRCTLSPDETLASGARTLHLTHRNLRELTLSGIRISATELRCPALEALDVSGAQLSDAMLVSMVTSSPTLRTLAVADCRNVTDAAVKDCVELRNDSITSLSLHAFSAMHSLKLACASLLTLELGRCCALTDASVTALAAGCPLLVSQRSLNAPRIPPPPLPLLPRVPVAQRELSLEECEGISHLALSSLSLQKLNLAGCKAIVTATLECAALHVLVLEGCSALDDASIT